MRTTAMLLLLFLPATVAHAEDTLFRRLHRGYDPRDPAALERAATLLAKRDPDFWHAPLPAGPLRGALARRLSEAGAVALLRGAVSPAVVLGNLSFRENAGALVLEAGLLPRLLPDHRTLLVGIAEESLLDDDRSLAVALLSDEPSVKRTARALDGMKDPAGLRLLADVATGAVALPAESLATLPVVLDPDVHNRYHVRPLGEARVRALGKAAAEHEDGAMRAFAARLLHASLEPAIFEDVVRAYRDADSWRIDDDEWTKLGANHGRITADRGVPIERKRAMLEGCFLWSHIRAADDPPGSEEICAHLRRILAAADPALANEIARMVRDHPTVAAGGEHGRRRPVPSYRGLLEDLRERPGLPGRVGARILAAMDEERMGRTRRRFVVPKPIAESAEDLRRMLRNPPATFEQRERARGDGEWRVRTGLDPSGGIPRAILLRSHAKTAFLDEILDDEALVASWPPTTREEAERLREARREARAFAGEAEYPTPAELCARVADGTIPWRERIALLAEGLSEEAEYVVPALAAWIADRAPRLDSDLPEPVIRWWIDRAWDEELDGLEPALRAAVEKVAAAGPRVRLRRRLAAWAEGR